MTNLRIRSDDGCFLAVRLQGRHYGTPILLSHPLGTTLDLWHPVASALASQFRVISYDSRGHGGSDAPEGPYDIATLARDARGVLDALQISRTHFVGLSLGGMTGMQLAAYHPDRIDHLVLANTTAFIPNKVRFDDLIREARHRGMHGIAQSMILDWLSSQFKAAHPEETDALIHTMRTMSPAGFAGACAVLRDVDLRDATAHIQAPTLVINGVEDGERGSSAAAQLARGIRGARRVDLADAAHLSALENPLAFSGAVLEFLA